MRFVCILAAALAVSASSALAQDGEGTAGIVWSPRGAVLTQVDTVSRLAVPGARSVLLGHAHYALSTSPDGALLASASGIERRILLSDLGSLGRPRWIGPLAGQFQSTFWIARRLLVAHTESAEGSGLVLLDASGLRVRKQVTLDGRIVSEAATSGRYVALVAPARRIGALRLVWLTPAGRIGWIDVPQVRGGLAITRSYRVRLATPGLAITRRGDRAFVVPRENLVVELDLERGRARVLALREDRTLQAAAKSPSTGWQRTSRLLGATLVSTGSDLSGTQFGALAGAPAGLRITDLRARRTHVALPGVNQFRICAGLIVAARSAPEPDAPAIAALDAAGRPLWSQFAGDGARLAGCTAEYVYVSIPGKGFATLATRSGAVLESHRGSAAMPLAALS